MNERVNPVGEVPREEEELLVRKVMRSGYISYKGHSYFVSKALAGRYIVVMVRENHLIIDEIIQVHKEYLLE
jgi:hypothetical protein